MKKNLAVLGITLTLTTIYCAPIYAKKIYPAEIMGRDLLISGLGWAGHVGIATTYMTSPQGMKKRADQVIEVLNENPVGQINSISNFKSRSKYWGSKYGVTDEDETGYHILVEANHQRWWNPEYTNDTDYHIGSGNPRTGQMFEHGRWRCDTYAWWSFYSQGLDTMPGRIWLPRNLFNYFPYFNDERFSATSLEQPLDIRANNTLENTTAEELNNMPYEEFQMIMDTPPLHYVTSPSTVQVQFAYDSNLNDVKRGIMIDRLTSKGTEPDLVPKLIQLYHDANREAVKTKIISGLVFYNQNHLRKKPNHRDNALLKNFFAQLINTELSQHSANWATTGFIEMHSSDEILQNLDKIDYQLVAAGHYASIMIKYSMLFKSKQLERIYIKSIVNELRKANNSDLDSYLFGPLSIGYQGTGKNLLDPESKQVIVDYLKEVRYKYIPQGIKAAPKDIHRNTTAPYYFELIKNMGI